MSAPPRLDPFQDALLHELRQAVAAGVVEPGPAARRPHRRVLLAAAVVAALVGAGLALPALSGEQPAYAVVRGANGRVEVRVERLDDAAGLERALATAGVRADVTYLRTGVGCAPGRYADAVAPIPGADFRYEVGDNGYRLVLGPGAVGDDQTVVIEAGRVPATGDPDGDGISDLGGSWSAFGVAEGPVAPCRPVPRDR